MISWSRIAAIAVLFLLLLLAPYVTALALSILAVLILVAVAASDRFYAPACSARPPRLDGTRP